MEETELCFPHINSSCRKQKRSHTEAVLSYTLLSFISLLTTTLNLLVIVSISHFKQLHTPTNLLLLSLAVSDFFVGLLMSFLIILTDGCWFLGDHTCALYGSVSYVVTFVAVGTMVLISADRHVAICDPLHYHQKITVRRVYVINVLCWTCSVLYISVMFRDEFKQPGRYNSCYGECVIVFNYTDAIIDFILLFVFPVTVIIVLHVRVFAVAVSQARAMRCHIAAVTLKRTSVHVRKSEIKAARTLGIVVIAFLICYSPMPCSYFVQKENSLNTASLPIEIWLLHINSCLNPLIYVFFYPWFRKSVKLIVTLKILLHGSSKYNIL
ncbi:trace amine-associated receptor 8a-like [Odontesthes bonariensis]